MSGALLFQNPDGASFKARAVLELLRDILADEISHKNEEMNFKAEPKFTLFDNCREQGYTVFLRNAIYGTGEKQINIAFAENRNSDDIVVYVFEKQTFNAPTVRDLTDDDWEKRKFFRYDAVYAAAQFIADTLTEFWNENAVPNEYLRDKAKAEAPALITVSEA